ncbi:MAG: SprT-like domain-containing protein [Oscillospiraceae bacterium]|nr:SprT-like domain-containing protein [Oscillospiraceae bacterium]
MHTLDEVRAEYDRLDAICGVDTRGVALRVSTRAVKRLGAFRLNPTPEILISALVLADDTLYLDTVRHEYAHAVVALRHPGERHGHDAVWKAVCREVGCTPKATTEMNETQRALRVQKARYLVRCNGCGAENYYLREGAVIRALRSGQGGHVRCAWCGGHDFALLIQGET